MTRPERLEVYELLRKAHVIVQKANIEAMDAQELNAFESVNSTMYLAEGFFAEVK